MEELFKPSVIGNAFFKLFSSLPVTLEITVISALLGLLLGFLLALAKIRKIPLLSQFATVYISFMRGTPLLVQIFLSYYGIPMVLRIINYQTGSNYSISAIPAIAFAFVAFSMNEAAQSLGMTEWQTMRRVVLPQAMVVAIPNLGNSLISLVKSTSLAYTIGVIDLTGRAKILAGNNLRFFETYIGLALVYWIICVLIEFLVHALERRFNYLDREVKAG